MKFIQQAYKGENEWWTYIVVLLLFLFGWQFIGVIPLIVTAILHSSDVAEFQNAAVDSFAKMGINSNLYLVLVIFTFFGGLVALFFGIIKIHKRSILTVLTSREKLDWNRIFFAFFVWASIGIIVIGVDYYLAPENFIWNFKLVPFTILCLISFLLLPIQTTMEEVLFRGYLMQGFGTWFKKGFIALIITSVIFGLLHGANPEVQKLGWISMVYYIGTGLLLGIFAIMDEGMELSLGFHAANNIIAAVLVTTNWTVFQTDALLIDTSEPSAGIEMFLPVLVLFPIVLYVFSKKYGWKNWEDKMFATIRKPIELNEDEFIA
ncbi:hypothetical protein SAMN05444411_10657 [Lutibacter oricola]|uniref:CAAX prenyl protease 2/Lysostaphin resistance protein A-like domain-containing protein n=1 Tax=Lutibacter oricola TaxID=762486 RepID=A0A1H3C574_9FLAO|nr:CPBP family intramembrane glutamic endopeptidase [Lutibacter oricola]SDX49241.1 hypothetical protein SAMN05444411_10657 [Lutibacter oricola]